MDNGRDLIEMVVSSYETPDAEVDEDGGHDYSASSLHSLQAFVEVLCDLYRGPLEFEILVRLFLSAAAKLKRCVAAYKAAAGGFKTFILKEGTTIICAGTVRTFGNMLAELPFVGTREGYRCEYHHEVSIFALLSWARRIGRRKMCLGDHLRFAVPAALDAAMPCSGQGALRTFMTSLEAVLTELGVKQLVVASIMSLKRMWRNSFNFRPLTVEEASLAEEYLVSPDPETCVMMRKPLGAQVCLAFGAQAKPFACGKCCAWLLVASLHMMAFRG